MSNEKILDKLYDIVFNPKKEKDQKEANELDQSTAKLTEYWKMEAEQTQKKLIMTLDHLADVPKRKWLSMSKLVHIYLEHVHSFS